SQSSHRIQTSRHADERARATLVTLQKCFVAPVRLCAAPYIRLMMINVDQATTNATDLFVREVRNNHFQNIWLVVTGRVREHDDFTMSLLDRSVLRGSFAQAFRLTMK